MAFVSIVYRRLTIAPPPGLCKSKLGVAVLLFCQRGSDRIGVTQWNGARVRLRCFTCEREAWLDGFTISELDPVKLVAAAPPV